MSQETPRDTTQPNLLVHNIYTKDISFEAPHTPGIFAADWNPKIDFDLSMSHAHLSEEAYEATLHVTVKVELAGKKDNTKSDSKQAKTTTEQKEADTRVAFLVEIKQAGVFGLPGQQDEAKIEYVLSTVAPGILFPYAREVVANCVTKGGFPQLVLPPMNFDAMYQQHLAKQANTEAKDAKKAAQ